MVLKDQKIFGEGLQTKRPRMRLGSRGLNSLTDEPETSDILEGSKARRVSMRSQGVVLTVSRGENVL